MKMLIPVDGSLASFNAAKKAAEIARTQDSAVMLLTVIDYDEITRHRRNEKLWRRVDGSLITSKIMLEDEEEFASELRRNGEKLLDSLVEDLDFGNAKVQKVVMTGEPYQLILETAKGINADMIVMGNRGFSKIKRFFVGSVTQRVISEAPCPVLVIHTDAED